MCACASIKYMLTILFTLPQVCLLYTSHGLTARQRIISTVLTPAGKDLAIVLFLKICDQINFLIQTKNMGTALIIPDPAI